MVESASRLRFAFEACQHLGRFVGLELLWQDGLDGDRALYERIEPLINNAHRTLAEFTADGVLAELGDCAHLCLASISHTRV